MELLGLFDSAGVWCWNGFRPIIKIEAMMMMIRFCDGRSEEGILLSNRGRTMRVALRNSDDSAEFRFDRGMWLSEDDAPVRIEGIWPSGTASAWVN